MCLPAWVSVQLLVLSCQHLLIFVILLQIL